MLKNLIVLAAPRQGGAQRELKGTVPIRGQSLFLPLKSPAFSEGSACKKDFFRGFKIGYTIIKMKRIFQTVSFWLFFLFIFYLATACLAADNPQPEQTTAQKETASSAEPKLFIEGYKLWNFSHVEINPLSNLFLAQTYFEGIRPTPTGRLFDWREKLKLRIDGQVSDKVSVSYDLLQDPDLPPDQYNITITYDKTKLTFGDFTANITGNEFATLTKIMNGVMLTHKDTSIEAALISSKDRSNSKTDAFYGNGSKGPYKLSNTFIVENSESVFLNNSQLVRNKDYFMNYYDGEITFANLLSTVDYVEVKYEFSSLIDLFFPISSRREFTGGRLKVNWEKIFKETAPANPEKNETTLGETTETIGGADSRGPYFLKHRDILPKSEEILLDGKKLFPELDYVFDYPSGKINFLYAISKLATIRVKYQYQKVERKHLQRKTPEEVHFSTGVTYFQENTPAAESSTVLTGTDSFSIVLESSGSIKREYQLSNFPLVSNSETVTLDGSPLTKDRDYTVNEQKGTLKLADSLTIHPGQTLKADYKYYKNFSYTYTTCGNNSLDSYYLPFRPVVYASEIVRIKESGADVYKNLRKWDGTLSSDLYKTWEIVYTIDYTNGFLDFKQLDDRGNFIPYLVASSTAIAVDFRYIQEQTTAQQSLNNQLVGVDSDLNVDQWDFKVNVAQSQSNQPLGIAWQTDTFSGNGTKTYSLTHQPLSDSELVSVNGNLLTADIDYLINYSSKKITFIKYAPSLLDTISVRYRYQITPTEGQQKGRALALSGRGEVAGLKIESALKKIDPSFYQVGGAISRGSAGSRDEILKLNYDFTRDFSAGASFEKYADQIGANSSLEPIYLYTEKTGYNSQIKPFAWGVLNLSLLDTKSYDRNPGATLHDYDNKRTDLKASFQFGPKEFSSLLEAGRTSSCSDYLDQLNEITTAVYFFHGKNFWKILENLKLNTDLQRSDEKTDYYTQNTNRKKTVDAVDLTLNFDPYKTFNTETSVFWQKIDPHSLDFKVQANKKLAYRLNYTPYSWLTFRYGRQDEQRTNVFENQPSINTNSFSWSSTINTPAAATLGISQNQRISTEGADKKYDSSGFSINLSYPLSQPVELKLGYNFSHADSLISQTYRASFDRIYSAGASFKLTPVLILKSGLERDYFLSEQSDAGYAGTGLSLAGLAGLEWKIFNDLTTGVNFKIEDYRFNSTPITKTDNYYAGAEVKFTPANGLNLNASVYRVYIKDASGAFTRPSTELKSLLKIPVFERSWANLEFERIDTTGKLKKTILEDTNSVKQTLAAGLDFEIPLENTKTSLTVSVTYKKLSYTDRQNAKNNLEANVVVGEARLDF
jgi:hypothetical protein